MIMAVDDEEQANGRLRLVCKGSGQNARQHIRKVFFCVSALVLGWQIKSKISRTVIVSEYIPKLGDATCGSARARSGQTTMLLLRTNLQWLFALPKHPITFLNADVSGVHTTLRGLAWQALLPAFGVPVCILCYHK